MERCYSLGLLRAIPGREHDLRAAWQQLCDGFGLLDHPPAGEVTLVESINEPGLHYSFAPWHSREDLMAMRRDSRVIGFLKAVAELCTEVSPGLFRVVGTSRPRVVSPHARGATQGAGQWAESTRSEVPTAGGGKLAVWTAGTGAPVVLVHGSLGDHTGFTSLIEAMKGDFTTFAMDRRGFGASVDADFGPYSMDREFRDVADVVDAVAARTGRPVTLVGHSFGANCAMGAATLTRNVDRLVLYEPSLGLETPVEEIEEVERQLAAGNREAAVLYVLVSLLELSPDEVAAVQSSPRWPNLLAGAHTMPRETRIEMDWKYVPGQFDGIAVPVLLLAGSESTPGVSAATVAAAAAIPDAIVRVLAGQGHLAHRTDPELVANLIRGFVGPR